jgi:hypothetical protein
MVSNSRREHAMQCCQQSPLPRLQSDKRAFFTACSQAPKAADYWRGLAPAASTEVASSGCGSWIEIENRLRCLGAHGEAA